MMLADTIKQGDMGGAVKKAAAFKLPLNFNQPIAYLP